MKKILTSLRTISVGLHPELGPLLLDKGCQEDMQEDMVRLFRLQEKDSAIFYKKDILKNIREFEIDTYEPFRPLVQEYLDAYKDCHQDTCSKCKRKFNACNFTLCEKCGKITCRCGRCSNPGCASNGFQKSKPLPVSKKIIKALTKPKTPNKKISLKDKKITYDENLANAPIGAHLCIDCAITIPAERLKVNPNARRCISCQADYESQHDTRIKVNEGLGGSRDDVRKMKAKQWGEMVNRGRGRKG